MTKINERQLDRLQSVAKWAALAVLLVFVVLIGYSGLRLKRIQDRIADSNRKLANLNQQVEGLTSRRAELDQEIAALEQQVGALREIGSRIAEKDSDLYKAATAEAIGASQPYVFPHIRREGDRRTARRLAERLEKAGFVVPGIQNVGDKSPRRSQVRYFRRTEEVERDVRLILGILEKFGVAAQPTYVPGFEDAVQRQRQYEIWLSDDLAP